MDRWDQWDRWAQTECLPSPTHRWACLWVCLSGCMLENCMIIKDSKVTIFIQYNDILSNNPPTRQIIWLIFLSFFFRWRRYRWIRNVILILMELALLSNVTLRRRDVYIFYDTVFYFLMVIFYVLTLTQFTVFEYVTSAIVFRPQHASSINQRFTELEIDFSEFFVRQFYWCFNKRF